MNVSTRLLALASAFAILASSVILPLSASPAAEADDTPQVVFTEICFNPTFEENDYGLKTSADVFEYVEFANISSAPLSLQGIALKRSTEGWEGSYRQNTLFAPDGGDCMLAPGETAIIAILTGDGYTAGLRTATPEDRTVFYDRFAAFYNCADRLPRERFYIADTRDNATGEAIENSFNLANSHEDVVLRLTAGDEILCEVNFSAVEWNRNGYALNLTYRAGGIDGHPQASVPFNLGAPTPGLVRDNQLSTDGMLPPTDTFPIHAMQYNICATDSPKTDTDGSAITMEERIGHAFNIIETHDPDILALCEINYLWVPRLESELTDEGCAYAGYGRSSKGSTYGSKRINRETWDLFNLILWKDDQYELIDKGTFWCSSTPDTAGTFSWSDGLVGDFARGINWVILRDRKTGGEFFVLCAHIDAKVAEARRRSAEQIVDTAAKLAEGRPIMMFGDWNSNERAASYPELIADGFADVRYRIPDPSRMTLYGTVNNWGDYTEFKSRAPIDHCIITPHNVFAEAATIDPGYFDDGKTLVAADHNATVFDLQVAIHKTTEETAPPAETTAEPTTTPETVTTPPDTTVTEIPAEESTTASTHTAPDTTPVPSGGCRSSAAGTTMLLLSLAAAMLVRRRTDSR